MIIEGASDRLEERLERLAKLHTDGDLDDNEYRSAKALLLSPTDGTTDATDTSVRTSRTARLGSVADPRDHRRLHARVPQLGDHHTSGPRRAGAVQQW